MFSIELILFGGLLIVATLVLIAVIALSILVRRRGVTATATITQIEEKIKYKDTSIDKHIAYDYAYQYVDCHGQTQHGTLYKNAPLVEFNVGDTVEILYIRYWPRFSIYRPLYKALSFLPWIIAIMWLVLLLIFVINL